MSDMTITGAHAIVREYFNLDGAECDYVLWNYTGWPSFWRDPDDIEGCIRESLETLKLTVDENSVPCDFCGKPSIPGIHCCVLCFSAVAITPVQIATAHGYYGA